MFGAHIFFATVSGNLGSSLLCRQLRSNLHLGKRLFQFFSNVPETECSNSNASERETLSFTENVVALPLKKKTERSPTRHLVWKLFMGFHQPFHGFQGFWTGATDLFFFIVDFENR